MVEWAFHLGQCRLPGCRPGEPKNRRGPEGRRLDQDGSRCLRARAGRGHRMIEHLQGRENSLEPFGWTGRKAEWIALACLHSGGLFTRAQLCFQIRMNRWQAFRFIRALVTKGLAAEDSLQDRTVCRVFSSRIFRALGTEDNPPPPDGFCGNSPAPARARLRAGASRIALAADRDGEGPCLRLEQQARKHRYKTMIEGYASWGSTRIAIGGF